MSIWATLEATFEGLIEDDLGDPPAGSEGGPTYFTARDGTIRVSGRLRDFGDTKSPEALAWFVGVCDLYGPPTATLMIDIDCGPRYRYEWRDDGLHKLRGILDG